MTAVDRPARAFTPDAYRLTWRRESIWGVAVGPWRLDHQVLVKDLDDDAYDRYVLDRIVHLTEADGVAAGYYVCLSKYRGAKMDTRGGLIVLVMVAPPADSL